MTDFHVGMKVVCVEAMPGPRWLEHHPAVGDVLTIRGLDPTEDGERLYLWFEEIRNMSFQYRDSFGEVSFNARRFRPVVSRKTDISVFLAMLTPNKEKQTA